MMLRKLITKDRVFKYLFFGLLFPLQGNGLESDQRQPIRIQADKAVITEKEEEYFNIASARIESVETKSTLEGFYE